VYKQLLIWKLVLLALWKSHQHPNLYNLVIKSISQLLGVFWLIAHQVTDLLLDSRNLYDFENSDR